MTDYHYSSIDPYGGGSTVDPYGGADPSVGAVGTEFGKDSKQSEIEDPFKPRTWRTWRTKGAFRAWKALPRIWPYLRPYRKLYVIVVLLMFLAAIVALAQPWPLAVMFDSVLGNKAPAGFLKGIFGSDPNPYTLLIVVVVAGLMITLIGHGIEVINNYAGAKLEQNMILDLRTTLFKHCQRLSLTFHDERFTGQLMAVINMQAAAMGQIAMVFPPLLQAALTLIGMLVIALWIDWQVTLISLVAVPMIYYASGLYGTRIVPRVQQVMSLEWRSLSIVFEAMSMLRVIVSFGREKYEHRRFSDQGRTAVDARVKLTVRQTLFTLGVTAATSLGTALVLGFGAWHVLRGEITSGELLVLISYIAAVYHPLEQIGTTIGHLHQNLVFLNAVFKLLETEPEVSEIPDAIHLDNAKGEIQLENVRFAYAKRGDALKQISFHVKAGERVAVVGPTGAGKTTLVNLLVRFYDPKEGRILIDGIDIKQLTLKSLRESISLVLQQPLLFSGSIAANIRYGRLDATMDDIIAAAQAANVHDFISALPDGYETMLGEGGAQLSAGERQRICIARAFIKDAPILILDEPTSSIDSKTENVILDALDDLMVGRTSFMIAHRLSTIHDADRILVINHGELVEEGTHQELIGRDGLYRQLYEAQTRQRARRRALHMEGDPAEAQAIDALTRKVGDQFAGLGTGNGEPEAPVETGNGHPAGVESDGGPAAEAQESAALAPAEPQGGLSANGHLEEPQPPAGETAQPPPTPRRVRNGRHTQVVKIPALRKELHCDVCGRALLKGEIAEPFLAPSRQQAPEPGLGGGEPMKGGPYLTSFRALSHTERKLVCELCWPWAEEQGWTALPVLGGPTQEPT
jgi:ATP-binding cassette subfamily B protein